MFRRYGFFGFLRIVRSLIFTKVFYPQARLIRLPFDIRNRRYIKIGPRFTTGVGCRIEASPSDKNNKACIVIGSNVQINDYVHIGAINSVVIGDNVLIASKIYISDHNHGSYTIQKSDHPMSIPINRECNSSPVFIEDCVWLGESVSVLPGVVIGKGTIIGANSVVTKSIPPYSIAVGIPAKVIKKFDFDSQKWISI
jgi:lipopolysaccharide O-acetyltransferase